MNTDVEFHIRQNYAWNKLPANVKQSLGNSQREYEKAVFLYSIKHQLRYKSNLIKHTYKKDERLYYEELLRYSREHLMLYPYHLSDVMVKGLRITPFAYYVNTMIDIMNQEKSYDSLPNFTAADCLRLMGIGRNQYIDLMNQCRSSKKFFRKKPVKDLLPGHPIDEVSIDPWWKVHVGYITEEDIKMCNAGERKGIDLAIDKGAQVAAGLNYDVVHGLYRKGLVYLEVPIADEDCIVVPPLEGFVMNRVLGDYFETLLYKIFVSIDEHTTVAELANVLEIDLQLVKNAVSMYCRLGFAKKKGAESSPDDVHPSWKSIKTNLQTKKPTADQFLIDWTSIINEEATNSEDSVSINSLGDRIIEPPDLLNVGHSKRIAFIFDSTLTAFLMMGNLSPGLKSHAVTMFEVGKLSDESLDSFLSELEKIYNADAEGEAQRYFDHAVTLRDTIRFLRHNRDLCVDDDSMTGQGIDLLRCESLLGLDPATCARVLNKNYSLLISMAPLSNEIRPISSCSPQHLGPAIPEVNSVWFKMFIYHMTGCGPPSLLLVKGVKLRKLPKVFQKYDRLLMTTWGHDPGVIPTSNILLTLNDALTHSACLIQGHSWHGHDGETQHVSFPFNNHKQSATSRFEEHMSLKKLQASLDLQHNCGYVTFVKTGEKHAPPTSHCAHTCDLSMTAAQSANAPKNGIQDAASAQVLRSELDLLDNSPQNASHSHTLNSTQQDSQNKIDRTKLNLELKDGGGQSDESCDVTSCDEWVLLECCYGIPLFNAELNSDVCNKILKSTLCKKDSLQNLLNSSRKLSLKLLNFIADHQDLPVIQEHSHESGMIPSAGLNIQQTIPLPTHNLIFTDGILQQWTG